MKELRVPVWVAVAVPFISIVLGSGAIWSWKSAQVESARLELETAKTSMDLRTKMNELLIEIMKFQGDWLKRTAHYPEYKKKIEDYNALEEHLARMEKRNPRRIDFENMLLKAPKSFRIE
jgi:hypothetical protein